MPTKHGLGFGNGRLVEYEDGTVAYYKTGEFTQAFRVPIADIESFSVVKERRPWERTLKLIGCGTVLASARVPSAAAQKVEEWFRRHPLFGGNASVTVRQAVDGAAPSETAGLLIADELRKLASLCAEGILTDEEFVARKQRLLDRGA